MTFEEWWGNNGRDITLEAAINSDSNKENDRERVVAATAWGAAQQQWQPPETAPKDKDILLLTKGGDVATGYWGYEDREDSGQWMWFDGEPIVQEVVGWMPKEVLIR